MVTLRNRMRQSTQARAALQRALYIAIAVIAVGGVARSQDTTVRPLGIGVQLGIPTTGVCVAYDVRSWLTVRAALGMGLGPNDQGPVAGPAVEASLIFSSHSAQKPGLFVVAGPTASYIRALYLAPVYESPPYPIDYVGGPREVHRDLLSAGLDLGFGLESLSRRREFLFLLSPRMSLLPERVFWVGLELSYVVS